MRMIDADAMKADLLTVDPQYETMIHWCLTVLDAQPTIEERKKGEWIEIAPEEGHDIYTVKCDQCGKYDFFETNFCPNCGADMRGGHK